MNENKVWSHGGSAGDILYHLTPMKDIWRGDGTKSELYINRNCNEKWRMPVDKTRSLLTLIDAQPYIAKTGIRDDYIGIDLDNLFRHPWLNGMNLSDIVHTRLKMEHTSREDPWLFNVEPNRVARVVIHRSPRYHVKDFPWQKVLQKYGADIIFVGHWSEHAAFVQAFGPVAFYHTKTYMDLARVIQGAVLFVGNQSSPAAVAQGLRQNMVQETVERWGPDGWAWNCHWSRKGFWDNGRTLPEIDT